MNSNTLLGFVILSTILPKSFIIMDVLQKQGGVQWNENTNEESIKV
jgi:hypothetical protein